MERKRKVEEEKVRRDEELLRKELEAQQKAEEERLRIEMEQEANEKEQAEKAAKLLEEELKQQQYFADEQKLLELKNRLKKEMKELDEVTIGPFTHEIEIVKKSELKDKIQDVLVDAKEAIDICENDIVDTLVKACANKDDSEQYEHVKAAMINIEQARNGGYQYTPKNEKRIEELQEYLIRLEKIDKVKKLILGLDQKTIAEIKSFNNPKPSIINSMRASFYLLGNSKKELKEWKQIVALMSKTGKLSLKRRIKQHKIGDISDSNLKEAKKCLAGMDVNTIQEISEGVAVFYAWGSSIIMSLEE